MDVIYLDRKAWGADESLERKGYLVSPEKRTEIFIHHTVGVDDDATPNVFETLAEIVKWMRRLQTIRPELGLDVPYNYVVFFAIIDGKPTLVICEGRGWQRTGAHTKYHNTKALAWGIHGNFMLPTFGLELYLAALGPWIAVLRVEKRLDNLGSVRPARAEVFGHRDSGASTSCPGNHMYDALPTIKVKVEEPEPEQPEEGWSMNLLKEVRRESDGARFFIASDGRKYTLKDEKHRGALIKAEMIEPGWRTDEIPTLTSEELDAIPSGTEAFPA
jgi:hypothetical protein